MTGEWIRLGIVAFMTCVSIGLMAGIILEISEAGIIGKIWRDRWGVRELVKENKDLKRQRNIMLRYNN